jgi:flagellar motor switch protein FliG
VSPRDLAVSLSQAPRDTQTKVLSNISSAKQQAVLDELKDLPAVTSREVEVGRAQVLKNVDDIYVSEAPADPPPPRRLRSRLA